MTKIRGGSPRLRLRGGWLGLLALATILSLSNPALAETLVDTDQSEVVLQPMVVVGFDPEVVEAAGYKIVVVDGVEAIVPATAPDALSATPSVEPANQIGGPCGYSFVYISDVGPDQYRVRTGFHTDIPSISYSWTADVIEIDNTYFKSFHWGGPLAFRFNWEAKVTRTVGDAGYYTAWVIPDESWALTEIGVLCNSLGPTDTKFIN
jgi:hypothetical protein